MSSVDALTVLIERLDKGWLRDTLSTLREELRVDPHAIAFWCEFEPVKAERLVTTLVEELCDAD